MRIHRNLVIAVTMFGCQADTTVSSFNAAPAVAIVAPEDGHIAQTNNSISFVALVSDDSPYDALLIQWSSDIDGIISTDETADQNGNIEFVTANLSTGTHSITLTVTDDEAASGEDAVQITLEQPTDAPEIEITSPVTGEPALADTPFEFRAVVEDLLDPPDALWVTVISDLDGLLCEGHPDAEGAFACEGEPTQDDHLLLFTALDTDGNEGQASIYLSVLDATDIDNDGDGWTEAQGDCDDENSNVNPGLVEVADGIDNDCDELIDEGTYVYDDDGDGYSEEDGDCDDEDDNSYPGAPELEDGNDNDCDKIVDEGTNAYDDDGDGYSENDGDCDDFDNDASPAMTEICDFIDNDCDAAIDEENASGCSNWYADSDGDGYGAGAAHCICSESVESSTYTAANNSDCYDYNSSANPTTSSYFTSNRGDGSYDYNCDGSEQKEVTTIGGCEWDLGWDSFCDEDPAGWSGSAPSCGASADWIADCYFDWGTCTPSTTPSTMACK
jgi:hypothetical protein